jgi:hypothetical protein
LDTLTYTGTPEDDKREWRLIHARDAQLKQLLAQGHIDAQAAIRSATITCGKCDHPSPMAVRCQNCQDWLQPADNPDTDAAEAAILERDTQIITAFTAAKNS